MMEVVIGLGCALIGFGVGAFVYRLLFMSWALTRAEKRGEQIGRSSNASERGYAVENLLPFIPSQFPWHPKDARFMGAPIDYLIFDGMSDGDLRKIVLVEVKAGKAKVTRRQQQIKDAVEAGKVEFALVQVTEDVNG